MAYLPVSLYIHILFNLCMLLNDLILVFLRKSQKTYKYKERLKNLIKETTNDFQRCIGK